MRFQYLIPLCLMTSCAMYERNFDCPPPKGVCHAPVSTLEKMIVETPCGEDAFTGCIAKLPEKDAGPICRRTLSEEVPEPFQRRIWIAGDTPSFIYFDEEME